VSANQVRKLEGKLSMSGKSSVRIRALPVCMLFLAGFAAALLYSISSIAAGLNRLTIYD
jgi:hypothetical protein